MERWLAELANEGRAPATIDAYAKDVEDTLSFLAGRAGLAIAELQLQDIDRDALVESIAEYRTRTDPRYTKNPGSAPKERSPTTIARRVAALKVFFAWAYETDRIPADPAALLKTPKKPKRLPKAFDMPTAREIIDEADGSRWPERDQLIVILALTTGMRLGEIASLRISDIEGSPPRWVTVIGKGNKERKLPLAPIAQEAVRAYLPTRSATLEQMHLDASTLLISSRARTVSGRMTVDATTSGVAYVVDRILRKVGARRRGSRVHVLRHTFATLGLRPDPKTGQPAFTIRQLQAALGHANLATIQVYAEVSDEELVKASSSHPLANQ
jgi:site-specific recombinase XerD